MLDIKTLTLDEKLKLLTGADCWRLEKLDGKLPEVYLADGPHGVRKEKAMNNVDVAKATAMPSLALVSNTWNEEMAFLQGETIADECLEKGVDVNLAPGVNIKRTPLCGRNFEYFSEDPYLAGKMARGYIDGVQSKGVGATVKHYYGNNREYERLFCSSEIDERTAREIYLPAFEEAVKSKPYLVMCAYNLINGVYASEHKQAFDILRNEFGFDGVIVSDWCAVMDSAKSVKASLDLRMPYANTAYDELKRAYDEGWLSEEEIDSSVERILKLIEKVKENKQTHTLDAELRHQNAIKIAQEGIVLLKNEDNILPIKDGKVMICGPHVTTMADGGGSARAQSDYKYKGIKDFLTKSGFTVDAPDCRMSHGDFVRGSNLALKSAYENDICLLFMGTGWYVEGEGYDRSNIKLSAVQEKMILDIAKINKNVVVVLECGSAIDMTNWIDSVKGVVYAGFAGEGANEAIVDVLTGKVNPSGKLSETFPLSIDDTPTGSDLGSPFADRYLEGIFVGYRHYDTFDKEVLFPFGHGLSYSNFEYSNLKINKKTETDYTISLKVKNTSKIDGKEVIELYVKDVFSKVARPEKELKGFKKVFLKAGEEKTIEFELDYRSFAYYSVALKKWYVENGDFEVLVGSSSRDIRLSGKIKINLPYKDQTSEIN